MANPTLHTVRPDYTCGFQKKDLTGPTLLEISDYATYRDLAEISLTFTQGRVLFVQLHALIAVKPDTQIGRFVVRKAKPKRLNVLAIRSQDN
jgi:hypothetical protein